MDIIYETEEGAPDISYHTPSPDKNLIQQIPPLDINNIAKFHMRRSQIPKQPDALHFDNVRDILKNHPLYLKFRQPQWLNSQEMNAFMTDDQRRVFTGEKYSNHSQRPNTPRNMTQFINTPLPPVLSSEELEEIKKIQELKLETFEREVNACYDDLMDKGKEFIITVAELPWIEWTEPKIQPPPIPVPDFSLATAIMQPVNNMDAINALIDEQTTQEEKKEHVIENLPKWTFEEGAVIPIKEMGNINLATNENKTSASGISASGNDVINSIIRESKTQQFMDEYQKQFKEERDNTINNMIKRKTPSNESTDDNVMDMLFGSNKSTDPSPRLHQQAVIRSHQQSIQQASVGSHQQALVGSHQQALVRTMTKKYDNKDMVEIPYDLFSKSIYIMSCVAAARQTHSTK